MKEFSKDKSKGFNNNKTSYDAQNRKQQPSINSTARPNLPGQPQHGSNPAAKGTNLGVGGGTPSHLNKWDKHGKK